MSAEGFDKLIQGGRKLTANLIGSKFKIYRSTDYMTPIADKNLIGTIQAAIKEKKMFNVQTDQYSRMDLSCDISKLNLGDILISDFMNKTVVLVNKDNMAKPQVIVMPNLISISRPEYTTVGGFRPVNVEVVKDIPAAVFLNSAKSSTLANTSTQIQSGSSVWDIYTWCPNLKIQISDMIIDEFGNKSLITSVDSSDIGYKITTQSVKVGS